MVQMSDELKVIKSVCWTVDSMDLSMGQQKVDQMDDRLGNR
jgi:hypothetical protein